MFWRNKEKEKPSFSESLTFPRGTKDTEVWGELKGTDKCSVGGLKARRSGENQACVKGWVLGGEEPCSTLCGAWKNENLQHGGVWRIWSLTHQARPQWG